MTEEEIEKQAEIYAKEKHCKGECKNIPNCRDNDIENCCTDCIKTNEDFIAGAKWIQELAIKDINELKRINKMLAIRIKTLETTEHAIQWHDLRKNPDDLPKHSGLYCVQCGEVREYVKEEKSWFTVHFIPCRNCTEDTFLWCEFPQFKDKE